MYWNDVIELLRGLILGVAQVCNGSLGLAVLLVSLGLRLALLPLTLRLGRRALLQQRRLAALGPELERLRKRYATDPAAEWRATIRLYKRHGVKPLDPAVLAGGLVQAPLFGAFYAALRKGIGSGVRFLWIRDLALPSTALTLLVAALAVAGMAVTPSVVPAQRGQVVPLMLTAALTIWLLGSTSALFMLSTAAGTSVNLLQGILLRRADRNQVAAA